MISKFKRAFYTEQLRLLGIKQVEGKPVQELSDRDLKYALATARVKAGA
ncbi:hypothetical protein ACFPOH_07145 [Ureibacillus suwonensis]|uniref:Fur-regulated basic protein A n=1 Tax=Ureibacillus suwonensis TaxID=313007 RepID=A0ABW0RCH2_9BACL